jgi:hypothetical protein
MKYKALVGFILVAGIVAPETFGSWTEYPLRNRVKDADLIVIGELQGKREGFELRYSETWGDSTYSREILYAIGRIRVTEILKGTPRWETVELLVYDGSGRDGRPVFNPVKEDLIFWEGDSGIWILQEYKFFKAYGVDYPNSCLPIDSLNVVRKYLSLGRDNEPTN